MKVLKRIFFGILTLVLIFVIVGFILPRERHVERSIFIDAPPTVVFSQVNGFRNLNSWSPFLAVMPGAEYTYRGPDFGVGATISWSVSGPHPEAGTQTIVASTPYERVDIELDIGIGKASGIGAREIRVRYPCRSCSRSGGEDGPHTCTAAR